MSNKKKLDSYGTVSLSENCSAIIQRKLLKTLKDPGSFTIPCIIGKHTFSKALCDLGASMNLMSFSMAKKLNLGDITSTSLHSKWLIGDESKTHLFLIHFSGIFLTNLYLFLCQIMESSSTLCFASVI